MPPKNANKDMDDTMLQLFAEKLQEHKDQQDERHEVITDKLAGMSTLPPQPPDPPSIPSYSHITNPYPQSPTTLPSSTGSTTPAYFVLYEGRALSWFKWAFLNTNFSDWESFTRCLETRFGPFCHENHQAELFKLRKQRLLRLTKNNLSNSTTGFGDSHLRCELAVLRPHHIAEALSLAKLVESKIKDSKPLFYRPQRPTYNQTFNPLPSPHNPNTSRPPTTINPLPIKCLTTAQMQERRAQGLCYNCDEKYIVGHKCQPKLFLPLLVDELGADEDELVTNSFSGLAEQLESRDELIHFQLSEQALEGPPSPKSLRFQGFIAGHSVIVLVDTGSSNSIQVNTFSLFFVRYNIV
ncbi:hypothetical protein Lal_00003726 [Lupinus albus]|nr:hypothetical protein Lal_00003726 [Lupinus albus]